MPRDQIKASPVGRAGRQSTENVGGDLAVRTYSQVADEFFRRTGKRISKARVHQHLISAHRKLAALMEGLR